MCAGVIYGRLIFTCPSESYYVHCVIITWNLTSKVYIRCEPYTFINNPFHMQCGSFSIICSCRRDTFRNVVRHAKGCDLRLYH